MRRFKVGKSVGPAFPNANSIMQGCPLAILRINSLISAWANVLSSHPDTSFCSFGAFIDDKNARANSQTQLQQVIDLTDTFDQAVDAVVNSDKTVVFSTTSQGRKDLQHFQVRGNHLHTANDDRLLGAQLSFTKKRARLLANKPQIISTQLKESCSAPLTLNCCP